MSVEGEARFELAGSFSLLPVARSVACFRHSPMEKPSGLRVDGGRNPDGLKESMAPEPRKTGAFI